MHDPRHLRPVARTRRMGQNPSRLSSWSDGPRLPTLDHPNELPTASRNPKAEASRSRSFDHALARSAPQGLRLLLAAHSQALAFQSLPCRGRPGPPADRPSPSQVSDDLRPRASCSSAVTSLVGVTPRAFPRMCGIPRHSFRWPRGPRFPRAEEASSRVPVEKRCFAVRHRLRWDSLASPCGPESWLSSSSAWPFWYRPRAGRRHALPVRLSPGRRLPTPARLNEPPRCSR